MMCALALAETEHPFSAVSEFPRVHELSTLDTSLPAAAAAADDASEGEQLSAILKLCCMCRLSTNYATLA